MPVSAAGETASVMKIVKTAGTVSITGGKGKKIPLVKNMNLYDGYGVKTSEETSIETDVENTDKETTTEPAKTSDETSTEAKSDDISENTSSELQTVSHYHIFPP